MPSHHRPVGAEPLARTHVRAVEVVHARAGQSGEQFVFRSARVDPGPGRRVSSGIRYRAPPPAVAPFTGTRTVDDQVSALFWWRFSCEEGRVAGIEEYAVIDVDDTVIKVHAAASRAPGSATTGLVITAQRLGEGSSPARSRRRLVAPLATVNTMRSATMGRKAPCAPMRRSYR
jgi:hypothetical protein